VIEGLGETYDVSALDRPFGPVGHAVDATVAALRSISADRPVLIGHSAGAEIALLVAASGAIETRAVVIEAPVIGTGPPRAARRLAGLPLTRTAMPPLLRVGIRVGFARAFSRAWVDKSRLTPSIMEGYRGPLLERGVAEAMWAMTASAEPVELDWEAVGQLPCLIVRGDRDRWTTPVLHPAATVVTYQGCGHIPHEEQPDRFIADVTAFLRRLEGS
jgi:pimeloyl-ACP methyl ester carboxylesterase